MSFVQIEVKSKELRTVMNIIERGLARVRLATMEEMSINCKDYYEISRIVVRIGIRTANESNFTR